VSTATMRVVSQDEFGGPEVLHLRDVPRPSPIPTEVLVRTHAAGINPVDWKTREGGGMASQLGQPPHVLGWDVSGVIEEVGFGVTTLSPGDEVYGMPWFPRAAGGYGEYVTAPARQFARKPTSIDHLHAAGLPLAVLTAWQVVVDTAHVRAGDRVLVHAAGGGVGHLAVQIAKHLGAHVIGTASEGHHDGLRALGLDEVVDYRAKRFEDVVSDVDVVVDLIGDGESSYSTRSLKTLKRGGLLVAVPSGVSPELASKAQEAGVRFSPFLVEPDGAALATIAALVDAGAITVDIQKVYPLADAAQAHRDGESGGVHGKLVLDTTV